MTGAVSLAGKQQQIIVFRIAKGEKS